VFITLFQLLFNFVITQRRCRTSKSDKIIWYCAWRPIYIYVCQFSLEKEMFQTKFVDKFETHILCSIIVFQCSAVCEIMFKNIADPDTPLMTIRSKRIACWKTKTTNAHSDYVIIIITFPLQQWLHESASKLRYKYSACQVYDCQKKLW
jgi:hypothetical protein